MSEHGRALAVPKFEHHLRTDQDLNEALWQLSGARLVCHCRHHSHRVQRKIPDACERDSGSAKPPAAQVLERWFIGRRGSTRERSRLDGSRTANGSWCRLRLTRALRWPIPGVTREMVTRATQVPTARTVGGCGQTLRELR